MKSLHIVMPMAGHGSRFSDAGFKTPKPLIKVDGQPMFLKALSSLDNIDVPKKFTIIIRSEHDRQYDLAGKIRHAAPSANVVKTDDVPIGAARDAIRAEPFLDKDDAVIIMDCDLWFRSAAYDSMVKEAMRGKRQIDGGLLVFESQHPRYSYAEIGPDGLVRRTAEKIVISNRAITGAYFFTRAETFLTAATELLQHPLHEEMKEYYLSFVYGLLLKQGSKIGSAVIQEFHSLGTPEELRAYEQRQSQ